jgi:hypothetical protein
MNQRRCTNQILHQTGRGAAALVAASPGPAGEFSVSHMVHKLTK